ncbi:amyloid-beta A4 precursor protein-binding family A member 1 [Osmerus mordax]|uniref:amyloid-beta A4 precursor protein-binding family A member 1 n=1 Tax=Osmerus mordax TaxID=8014 RepID=UPI0035107A5E
MNPQEAELGQEVSEDVEADLERLQAPPPQRRHHDNGAANNVRSRQHSNNAAENNNHHHASQPSGPRYRRHEGRGGPQRRSGEGPDAELHQEAQQQPIPRPAVTRYRRQGDSEARLRAQQQRRQQRQQREAERQQREAERQLEMARQQALPQCCEREEDERERDDSTLARSASTESGFHAHTDRAEGDEEDGVSVAMMMSQEGPEAEGDDTYGVALRPEAEGYTESAEAEQQHHQHRQGALTPSPPQPPSPQPPYAPQPPPLPRQPLLDLQRPRDQEEAEEALNPGDVYAPPLYCPGGGAGGRGSESEVAEHEDEAFDCSLSEHVYEEIGNTPLGGGPVGAGPVGAGPERLLQKRAGLRLPEGGSFRQREAVGSRLHHYDERSDGESDSPEKEAEFAPYPRADSCDQDEEGDTAVTAGRERSSSQERDAARGEPDEGRGGRRGEEVREWTESGHLNSKLTPPPTDGEQLPAGSPQEEQGGVRNSREQRDAISLAIKDIKEAIEEVKTRTVRSPYTPDEPREPVWVMRQDLSPTAESDLQPPLGGDSPVSDTPSPQGAESSSRHLLQEDSFETPPTSNKESRKSLAAFPTYVEVPGPCDPEDLIDGIIFAANYLGSTQLLSDKTPSKNIRMMQAQEAVSRIKSAQKQSQSKKKATEGEMQPMTEVDLFISTQRIKVLNADSQDIMMDHPLRTISYIADIGNIVVLMARRRMPRPDGPDSAEEAEPVQEEKRQYKMICHVFESDDAQLIAQSIGQAFSVAYQEFLRANGINPEDLSQKEYSDLLNTQDMYNDDLVHFSKSENCKDVYIEKAKGEILGVVIVESGWGSILPTVIIANMMHAGPAEKSGRLNIGDQIMSINGTSLVGLPINTCQSIIKGLKNQARIQLNIVRCPPVTTVLIRRPDLRYQLGFSVQNGIICSLMRGGIAERGGVRVGHRIIEINSQSVVATPHEKIVHILSNAVGEIHMKTMPAAMYRLLTAQEQPVYI